MYGNWEYERFCGFSDLKVSFKLPILRGGKFKADGVWLNFVGFNSKFFNEGKWVDCAEKSVSLA